MTTVEAWFEADQQHGIVLDDESAVDKFLTRLAAEPVARLVALYLGSQLDEIHGGGFPSVDFLVGVGGDVPLGVLQFGDTNGLWVSKGSADADAEPAGYHYMGVGHEFPADAELPLEDVRDAVEEYVRTGQRPTCVEWQPAA